MPGINIGFDLGTSNMTAYVEGRGVIFSFASAVACDAYTGEMLEVGDKALEMTGRNPKSIKIIRPFSESSISDFDITVTLLKRFIDKICRFTIFKPSVTVGAPSELTSLSGKTLPDALRLAGAGKIKIIEHSYAAALGSGLSFSEPSGKMIIDIGGGVVDMAIVTMNGIAASKTIKQAGESWTENIVKYLRRERDIEAGYLTADYIKKKIGGAVKRNEEVALISKGIDAVKGKPINFEITSSEVYNAIKKPVDMIIDGVKELLSKVSPELCADIYENGITLTGRGSLLYGMEDFIRNAVGTPVKIAKEPGFAVVKGLNRISA